MNKQKTEELRKEIEFLHELELSISEECADWQRIRRIQEKRESLENQLYELENKSTKQLTEKQNIHGTSRETLSKKKPVLYSVNLNKKEQEYEELSIDDIYELCKRASNAVIISGGSR